MDTIFEGQTGLSAMGCRIREVDDDYTVSPKDDVTVLVDATADTVTVTLPPAAAAHHMGYGQIFIVKKIDSGANAVTVDGDGSEEIDGSTTVTLAAQFDTAMVQSDGTDWHLLAPSV